MLSPDNEPTPPPSLNSKDIEIYANRVQRGAVEQYEKFAKGEITREAVVAALLEDVSDVLETIENKKSYGAVYTMDSE
jgi:hypothetical protein